MEIQDIPADCQWQFDGRLWGKVRVEPWWHTQHREVDYRNEPFNDIQQEAVWRNLGFNQTYFTGDLYDMRRSKPKWVCEFDQRINLDALSWCLYKMQPGRVLPSHSDTYAKFKEIWSLTDSDQIVRMIFFLEDWQSGHYFEIESVPIVNWRAGDGIYWANKAEHLAANLGVTARYTLQLTGVCNQF